MSHTVSSAFIRSARAQHSACSCCSYRHCKAGAQLQGLHAALFAQKGGRAMCEATRPHLLAWHALRRMAKQPALLVSALPGPQGHG